MPASAMPGPPAAPPGWPAPVRPAIAEGAFGEKVPRVPDPLVAELELSPRTPPLPRVEPDGRMREDPKSPVAA